MCLCLLNYDVRLRLFKTCAILVEVVNVNKPKYVEELVDSMVDVKVMQGTGLFIIADAVVMVDC